MSEDAKLSIRFLLGAVSLVFGIGILCVLQTSRTAGQPVDFGAFIGTGMLFLTAGLVSLLWGRLSETMKIAASIALLALLAYSGWRADYQNRLDAAWKQAVPKAETRKDNPVTSAQTTSDRVAAGERALQDQDFAAALTILMPLGRQGDAHAEYDIGVMYNRGDGVPEDYKEAAQWYRKAADQGLRDAECDLGFLYSEGPGVERSSVDAVRWFTLSAKQGYPRCEFNLAVKYQLHEGVDLDDLGAFNPLFSAKALVKAAFWYKRAISHGHIEAQSNLAVLTTGLSGFEPDLSDRLLKAADKCIANGDIDCEP